MAAAFNLKIPRELKLCRDLFLSRSAQKRTALSLLGGRNIQRETERDFRNASDFVPTHVSPAIKATFVQNIHQSLRRDQTLSLSFSLFLNVRKIVE